MTLVQRFGALCAGSVALLMALGGVTGFHLLQLREQVRDIDHAALDTIGNAEESAKWVNSHGYGRVIVVTNNYHMPRSLVEFEALLARPGPWLAGCDFPFGLPRELVETLGWPTDWAACMDHYAALPRPEIRDRFAAFCDARPAGGKFAHRACDRPAGYVSDDRDCDDEDKIFSIVAGTKATVAVGTGNQTVTTNTSKVAIAGAEINSAATGVHTVAGALVKIIDELNQESTPDSQSFIRQPLSVGAPQEPLTWGDLSALYMAEHRINLKESSRKAAITAHTNIGRAFEAIGVTDLRGHTREDMTKLRDKLLEGRFPERVIEKAVERYARASRDVADMQAIGRTCTHGKNDNPGWG